MDGTITEIATGRVPAPGAGHGCKNALPSPARRAPSPALLLLAPILFILTWSSPALSGPIHEAAEKCDVTQAETLLNENPELVSSTYLNSKTALYVAARNGCKAIVDLLLAHGADVNARDNFNNTPMHAVAFQGNPDVAKLFIENGANVHARTKDGVTPLHYAAIQNHPEIEEILIAKGADVNARTGYDATPLCYAAYTGAVNAARTLLAHGADVNAADSGGRTPLALAAERNHPEMVKLLRSHNAGMNPRGVRSTDMIGKNILLILFIVFVCASLLLPAAKKYHKKLITIGGLTSAKRRRAGGAGGAHPEVLPGPAATEVQETAHPAPAIDVPPQSAAAPAPAPLQGRDIEMIVYGSSGITFGVMMLILAPLLGYAAFQIPEARFAMTLGFVLLLAAGMYVTLSALPYLGEKPLLQLSRKGFYNSAYGFIPWKEVTGMSVKETTLWGMGSLYSLQLNIPDLPVHEGQFHPAARFLYAGKFGAGRMVMSIGLRNTSEPPLAICEAAHRLWKQSTGTDAGGAPAPR